MTGQEQRSFTLIQATAKQISERTSESGTVSIFGSPFSGDLPLISPVDIGSILDSPHRFARSLNGEFVVIIENKDRVLLVNDRFASIPLFYVTEDRGVTVSFSYSSLWKQLQNSGKLKYDRTGIFEFLYYQRLFGQRTYDLISKFLPPASILVFDKLTGNLDIDSYWTPSFRKTNQGARAIAGDLADAVVASINRNTQDSTTPGLLLSGGMDSRVVLAGFHGRHQPECFTIGDSRNNEVDVAEQLAVSAGAPHTFIQRGASHYSNILSDAVHSGGAMYSFQHGHFFGLNLAPDAEVDLLLHGHGFDYMFQGMYLPSHQRRFLGKGTLDYRLSSIEGDPVDDYSLNAKYRLKGLNPFTLVQSDLAEELRTEILSDLTGLTASVRDTVAEDYDLWDYPTISAPGRHYTYLNVLSAGTLANQRTIAFDNDIYDLFFSIPAQTRYGTNLLAETVKLLAPNLMSVRNANTNLNPGLSGNRLLLVGLARSAAQKAHINIGQAHGLRQDDRSWPTGDQLMRSDPILTERASKLGESEILGELQLFDMDRIDQLVQSFQAGTPRLGAAILSLITVERFLKQ